MEDWKWWVGLDDETYHTECDTRDEAVRIASEEQDGGYILEAKRPGCVQISKYFETNLFLEVAEGRAQDSHGELEGYTEIFETTPAQREDLEKMVRAAMDTWQEKHGLKFMGFQFLETRNGEYIPAKGGSE